MATKQRISAKDMIFAIGDTIVGGAEEMTVTVSRDNAAAYEAGTYFPAEIVDGKITVEGSLTRAFMDVDLINDICPNQDIWPSLTIVGEVVSGKSPQRRITIKGAKFDSFDINSLAIDGYAKNALPFKATNWELSK